MCTLDFVRDVGLGPSITRDNSIVARHSRASARRLLILLLFFIGALGTASSANAAWIDVWFARAISDDLSNDSVLRSHRRQLQEDLRYLHIRLQAVDRALAGRAARCRKQLESPNVDIEVLRESVRVLVTQVERDVDVSRARVDEIGRFVDNLKTALGEVPQVPPSPLPQGPFHADHDLYSLVVRWATLLSRSESHRIRMGKLLLIYERRAPEVQMAARELASIKRDTFQFERVVKTKLAKRLLERKRLRRTRRNAHPDVKALDQRIAPLMWLAFVSTPEAKGDFAGTLAVPKDLVGPAATDILTAFAATEADHRPLIDLYRSLLPLMPQRRDDVNTMLKSTALLQSEWKCAALFHQIVPLLQSAKQVRKELATALGQYGEQHQTVKHLRALQLDIIRVASDLNEEVDVAFDHALSTYTKLLTTQRPNHAEMKLFGSRVLNILAALASYTQCDSTTNPVVLKQTWDQLLELASYVDRPGSYYHRLLEDTLSARITSRDHSQAASLLGSVIQSRYSIEKRRRALQGIERLGIAPRAVDAILAVAGNAKDPLRADALSVFFRNQLAGAKQVPFLVGLLRDKDSAVRIESAKALARLGRAAEAALPALIAALSDEDETVRDFAANAFLRMPRAAAPALAQELRNHEHPNLTLVRSLLRGMSSSSVPPLADLLKSKDWRVRHRATVVLGQIGTPSVAAAKKIVQLLGDAREEIRQSAAVALTKMGDGAVPELIATFGSGNRAIELRASGVLAVIAKPAVQPLVAALGRERCRAMAAKTLSRIGSPTVPSLLPIIANDNPRVRQAAADILLSMPKQSRAALVATLGHRNLADREAAYRILGRMKMAALPGLIEALSNDDERIRRSAVGLLAGLGGEAAPSLTEALGSNQPLMRQNATTALLRIGVGAIPHLVHGLKGNATRGPASDSLTAMGAKAVPHLVKTLNVRDAELRPSVEHVLSRIGQPASTALVTLLEGDHPDLRASAARILAKIGPQVSTKLVDALGHRRAQTREAASDLLVGFGREAVPYLVGALANERPTVRTEAIVTLSKIGEPSVEQVVVALRDDKAREAAAAVLTNIGEPAVPSLIESLATNEAGVKRAAERVLLNLGASAAKGLVTALGHKSAAVRESVRDILRANGPAVAPHLISALADDDPSVRGEATQLLQKLGPHAIAPLVRSLDNRQPEILQRVERLLVESGKAALPALVAALDTPDVQVRKRAARLLVEIDATTVSTFSRQLTNGTREQRRRAAIGLESLGSDAASATTALVAALSQEDSDVGKHATQALANIGAPAIHRLISKMTDGKWAAKVQSANAILKMEEESIQAFVQDSLSTQNGKSPGDQVVSDLLRLFGENGGQIRSAAASILVRYDSKAIRGLSKLLKGKNVDTRRAAAALLGQLRTHRGTDKVLILALNDHDRQVRATAAESLTTLGERSVPALIEGLKSTKDLIRVNSAFVLSNLGPKAEAAVPALVESLKDKNDNVKWYAAVALGEIRSKPSKELHAVQGVMGDANAKVRARIRVEAARSLRDFGSHDGVIEHLILAMGDDEADVRTTAADSLIKIGVRSIPALIQGLDNEQDLIRVNSAFVLSNLGPKAEAAVPALVESLSDKNHNVRWYAAVALGEIRSKSWATHLALQKAVSDPNKMVREAARRSLRSVRPIQPATYRR